MKRKIMVISLVFLILGASVVLGFDNTNKEIQTLNNSSTLSETLFATEDTFIVHNGPNNNFGSWQRMDVRNEYGETAGFAEDGLIKFDLSSIPSNALIISAKLKLYYYGWSDNNPAGDVLNLYRVTSNWDENTVTWNNQPTCSSSPTTYASVPAEEGNWIEWTVTNDAKAFIAGSQTNFGWKITDSTYWGSTDIPVTHFKTKEGGNSPRLEVEYTINNPPIADADGPYYADVNEIIMFDGSGSYDSDGSIVSYNWDFGDGYAKSGETPTHSYTDGGDYLVSLTVIDNGGKSDIDFTYAYINIPPVADAGGPYYGEIEEIISLNGSGSYDSDGTIDFYEWDLDYDGEYDDAVGQNVDESWTSAGEYIIALKVTDNDGSINTNTTTVHIINHAPAKPSQPEGKTSGKASMEYTYSTSTIDQDDDQVWFKWSWGDETESVWLGPYVNNEMCNASHTWTKQGNYEIKVKARDEHNEESEWSDPFEVKMPKSISKNPFYQLLLRLLDLFPVLQNLLKF